MRASWLVQLSIACVFVADATTLRAKRKQEESHHQPWAPVFPLLSAWNSLVAPARDNADDEFAALAAAGDKIAKQKPKLLSIAAQPSSRASEEEEKGEAKRKSDHGRVSEQMAGELQAGILQMKAEASALEEQKHKLLTEFGKEALHVDNLYHEAKSEIEEEAKNMLIAKKVCGQIKSCGECARASICGWCAVEGQCVPGDRLGSSAKLNIACSAYRFGTCDIISCSSLSRCGDCIAENGCGWCSASQTCFAGDAKGPLSASCPGATLVTTGQLLPWVHRVSGDDAGREAVAGLEDTHALATTCPT